MKINIGAYRNQLMQSSLSTMADRSTFGETWFGDYTTVQCSTHFNNQMELNEESDDPLLERRQLYDARQSGDEDKNDVELKLSLRLSRLSNRKMENQLPLQETSSLTSVDEGLKKGSTDIEDLILPSDIDVNSYKRKHSEMETSCVKQVHSYSPSLHVCQIIGKFLDFVGTPHRLQCIAMYLMVDGEEANADLMIDGKLETAKPDHDSGHHSNASEGPKPFPPRQENSGKNVPLVVEEFNETGKNVPLVVEEFNERGKNIPLLVEEFTERGKLQDLEDDGKEKEEMVKKHQGSRSLQNESNITEERREVHTARSTSGTGQLRAQHCFSRIPTRGKLTGVTGLAHVSLSSQINDRAQSGIRPKANSLPIVSLDHSLRRFESAHPKSVFHGISCGSKEDLFTFVQNIGMAPVNTGIMLEKFKDVFGMRPTGNILTKGKDYHEIHQFQGKEVFLCQSSKTGRLFVTKQVPIVGEDIPSMRQEQMRGKVGLHRPQQVDLVVANQDSCPWDGLAFIYGLVKRKLRGKELGEIFMEYCEGNTLHDNIKNLENLNVIAHLQLAEKLLDIVQYLHDLDIIHGDLKLENIGMRADGLALIDFEGAKHPSYKINTRGTYQYMPPWFRQCFNGQRFDMLKTCDMWAVGMILLRIGYGQFLFGGEYARLRNCDTCQLTHGACRHVKSRFLRLIENNYDRVQAYLPVINSLNGPPEKRLACLIHGLLSAYGPNAQFTAAQARDALHGENVVVQVLKNGRQTVAPIVVKRNMKMKDFICLPFMRTLKEVHDDLADGMWFSCERHTPTGFRHTNIDLNDALTECCVIHVHPTLPQPTPAQPKAPPPT